MDKRYPNLGDIKAYGRYIYVYYIVVTISSGHSDHQTLPSSCFNHGYCM